MQQQQRWMDGNIRILYKFIILITLNNKNENGIQKTGQRIKIFTIIWK